LYRALDSTGQTIDFILTAKRDTAAKRLLRRAIVASGNSMPRVMNVDKNPVYPAAVEALKAEDIIPRTIQGIEAMHLIRKGRVRWLANADTVGQATFIGKLFGLSA
jgi:IS6 family transposase